MGAARDTLTTPLDAALAAIVSPMSAVTADTTESASRVLLADAQTERTLNADPDLGGMTKDYGATRVQSPTLAPPAKGSKGYTPARLNSQQEYDDNVRGDNDKAYQNYLRNKKKNGGKYK